jgi:ubiquinone/menaquinone biosynthesis C-methylase UbiE
MKDNTGRFSNRVDNYIKYRPTYPKNFISFLFDQVVINENSTVADIGSGTGILTELLIDRVKTIYAVEPNKEMRNAAEKLLHGKKNFISINGTAENTLLNDNSIDYITAAQAFHWFDIEKTIQEFNRVIKPGGNLILAWNKRINETDFLKRYEEILMLYANDYNEVNHNNLTDDQLSNCFSKMNKAYFDNYQDFDFNGLIGRVLSSSYCPLPGTEKYSIMEKELNAAFNKYSKNNLIRFSYKTEVLWGNISCQ